jgi:membrane protein DedA with SNARE-associated domain
VVGGAGWFAVAVIADGQGLKAPMQQFQRLWDPLFTPAIGLLMAAALINGLWSWWQRRMQQAAQKTDS